jgi:hypothetical protein
MQQSRSEYYLHVTSVPTYYGQPLLGKVQITAEEGLGYLAQHEELTLLLGETSQEFLAKYNEICEYKHLGSWVSLI